MGSNRGLIAVNRRALAREMDGSREFVSFSKYDESDGLISAEANGGIQPAAARVDSTQIVFATQGGIAVVHLDRVDAKKTPPLPMIEDILLETDDERIDVSDRSMVEIEPATRDLAVAFTARSLRDAHHVQFRYRLVGYDKRWREVGNQRTARYTQLPAGRFTFEVQARLPGSEWSASVARLTLVTMPWWWERPVARAIGLMVLLLLVIYLVGWRERVLRRRASQLEALVAERTVDLRAREYDLLQRNTELQQSAAHIAALSLAKERFFHDISHDLRTPLSLTIGPLHAIEQLVADLPLAARVQQLSRTARRNAARVLDLLNELLFVDHSTTASRPLHCAPVSLAPLVRSVVSSFEHECERRGVTIALTLDTGLGPVLGDRSAVTKMLMNLLSHAMRHAPRNAEVRVGLACVGTDPQGRIAVQFVVTGSAPRDRAEDDGGAAERARWDVDLELAVVRKLAHLHGGEVVIEDSASGAGATHRLTVPFAVPSPHATFDGDAEIVADDITPVSITPSRPRVLVVNADSEAARAVCAMLEPAFDTHTETDLAAAQPYIHRDQPDLIVAEHRDATMDGVALTTAIRVNPATSGTPIILLAEPLSVDDRIRLFDAGADGALERPVDGRELRSRVRALLRWRERSVVEPVDDRAALPAASIADAFPELTPGERQWAQRLQHVIQQHVVDATFGVAELAREMAMDRSTLRRRTRELLRASPVDLLKDARLRQATMLLLTTEMGLSEVAFGCGFSSVAYFCKVFKAHQGCTPTEYRSRLAVFPGSHAGASASVSASSSGDRT